MDSDPRELGSEIGAFAAVAIASGAPSSDRMLRLQDLLAAYRLLGSEGQESVRATLGLAHSSGMWALAGVLAERALAERSCERILDGLTVLAVEDFRGDPRESRLLLVLLLWVDRRLGRGVSEWRAELSMFSETGARHMSDFLDGPRFAQELRAAGLVAKEVDGRVEFESIACRGVWPWPP